MLIDTRYDHRSPLFRRAWRKYRDRCRNSSKGVVCRKILERFGVTGTWSNPYPRSPHQETGEKNAIHFHFFRICAMLYVRCLKCNPKSYARGHSAVRKGRGIAVDDCGQAAPSAQPLNPCKIFGNKEKFGFSCRFTAWLRRKTQSNQSNTSAAQVEVAPTPLPTP